MDTETYKMTTAEWSAFKYREKLDRIMAQNRYYCKCGHSVIIMPKKNKIICSHCGHWIFKNGKDEFMFRLRERLK